LSAIQTIPALKCSQCGSELILVSQDTQKLEGYSSLITTKVYKCSNEECQKDIDKKTTSRIKLQEQQTKAKESRLKAKIGLRLNKNKILR
jgi:hypothetical protein